MKRLILTIGISCSGKTTWAKEQEQHGFHIVCRDDIRAMMSGGNIKDYKYTRHKEDLVTEAQFSLADMLKRNNKHIIVADTNLRSSTINKWSEWCQNNKYKLEKKIFDVLPHIAKQRNINRDYSIPPDVIEIQYKNFRKITHQNMYQPNKLLPEAVIIDIDGTISISDHRSPYDYTKVLEDTVNTNVVNLVKNYISKQYKVVLLSGRNEDSRDITVQWLEKQNIPYNGLYMRAMDDTRCDSTVKEEIFFRDVAPKYNVLYSIDDRDRVVERWRSIGLECWQVAEGHF